MADRDADGVNDAARAIGPSAMAVSADVTDEADVEAMVAACVERFGRLDVAFNNAGIAGFAPIEDYGLAQFQQVIDVCLTGVFLCLKHEAKQLIQQGGGGSLINTASLNAMQAAEGLSAYCSAKAGVAMLTKVAALELGRHQHPRQRDRPGPDPHPADSGSARCARRRGGVRRRSPDRSHRRARRSRPDGRCTSPATKAR